ncbi:MAG: hypothetical protein V7K41_17630 [Nostoc sp.]|uniref:type II toxin-antitoxin system VapC family toxin n=1 Tax=Nostoc sp. TaxID=1180 RepID=UPI002FF806F3
MSDLVTDTHALIWYLEDSPNLSVAANEAFDKCDRGEITIYIPTICLVEIVYLQERRRISADMKYQLDIALASESSGLALVNLTGFCTVTLIQFSVKLHIILTPPNVLLVRGHTAGGGVISIRLGNSIRKIKKFNKILSFIA